MKSFSLHHRWQSLMAAFLIPLLAFLLACGPGEEPTPTPKAVATATPTAAPAATPTPTRPGPAATPTPTSVAAPTATPTPGVQPKRGGVLDDVRGAPPPSFDPYLNFSPDHFQFLAKLYVNILANYEGEKLECEVCSEWHQEDSGKSLVFKLIPGIKFHSGKEMTSADVAYSLKMIIGEIDGLVSVRAGPLKEYVKSIEAPEKYTVKLNLIRPSAFVPKILSMSAAAIVEEGTTRDQMKSKPRGSGPFILAKEVPGVEWTLERNPAYFKPGQPYLDRINKVALADRTGQFAAFFTGKAPYVSTWGFGEDQFLPNLRSLNKEGKLLLRSEPGGAGPHAAWPVFTKPPFNDLRLRQAVNLAMDRVEFGKAMYGDDWREQVLHYTFAQEYGTPKEKTWNVIPGWGTGAKKAEELEKAKKLVVDAGFPTGMDIPQFISTNARVGVGYQAGDEVLQATLKRINIRTTFDVVKGPADFVARGSNHDFLMMWYIYFMTTYDPDEVLSQYWVTGAARNWHAYSNAEVDKLFIQMSSETDPAKRKALFFQIQDIIVVKDVAYMPTPTHDRDYWVWSWLGGFSMPRNGEFSTGLNRADRFWIKAQ